jgi:phosphoribosylamine--glycine ligase
LRILIVGSGGREHALAWKLNKSPSVKEIFIAPGNGGTWEFGENIAVQDDDLPGLVNLAKEKKIDLVVAGPELPLVLGLSNALAKEGILCFGPNAYAAQLEGSKAFAKSLMREANVPTADFQSFDDYDRAREYVSEQEFPLVIKADGLAAGKGVVVARSKSEALIALEEMMSKKVFGAAGERVVIEEALEGEEASFLAFCDGHNIVALPSSQDHKPIGEGDTGLNTGGMGAYSPAPVLPPDRYEEITNLAIRPLIQTLNVYEQPFQGVLYAGLMMTDSGPKVLEYNVRFGDPECQPLMMRLDADLAELMLACVQGNLDKVDVSWSEETALCVVLAAHGYPGAYKKGMEIKGVEKAEKLDKVKVFQAGTKKEEGRILSSGGRVLGVTALGADLSEAKDQAYEAVNCIEFENCYYRRDIGEKGLKRSKL